MNYIKFLLLSLLLTAHAFAGGSVRNGTDGLDLSGLDISKDLVASKPLVEIKWKCRFEHPRYEIKIQEETWQDNQYQVIRKSDRSIKFSVRNNVKDFAERISKRYRFTLTCNKEEKPFQDYSDLIDQVRPPKFERRSGEIILYKDIEGEIFRQLRNKKPYLNRFMETNGESFTLKIDHKMSSEFLTVILHGYRDFLRFTAKHQFFSSIFMEPNKSFFIGFSDDIKFDIELSYTEVGEELKNRYLEFLDDLNLSDFILKYRNLNTLQKMVTMDEYLSESKFIVEKLTQVNEQAKKSWLLKTNIYNLKSFLNAWREGFKDIPSPWPSETPESFTDNTLMKNHLSILFNAIELLGDEIVYNVRSMSQDGCFAIEAITKQMRILHNEYFTPLKKAALHPKYARSFQVTYAMEGLRKINSSDYVNYQSLTPRQFFTELVPSWEKVCPNNAHVIQKELDLFVIN